MDDKRKYSTEVNSDNVLDVCVKEKEIRKQKLNI